MNHQSLSELLSLANLSPENLEKILAHDRWKTELILEHELKIEELRNSLLSDKSGEPSYVYTEDDKNFNILTSNSECNDSQMFRMSKTKVKNGIAMLCQNHFPEYYKYLSEDKDFTNIPSEDRNRLKVKSLFTVMTYFICCSERIRKWPMAKDKSSFPQVRKELEMKCSSFNSESLEVMYKNLPSVWSSMFGEEFLFNDKEIAPIILDISSKNKPPVTPDIVNSPLFRLTLDKFPRMEVELLKKYCDIMPFIDAGVKTLTLDFIKNRPPELDHTDEYAEWKDIYINHLHEYKENWKNGLKAIYISTEEEQKLWQTGSTSSPTVSQ